MYQISQTLRTAIAAGNPQRVLIEFTHKPDGTAYSPSVVFSNEDIVVSNGLQLTEEFNPETDLTIGSCPSAEIQFTLLNDNGQLLDFEFGTFKAYLGARIDSGTPAQTAKTKTFTEGGETVTYEFCPLGTFISPRPDVVKKLMIDVDANDQMILFDADMPTALQTYTGTLAGMATALCNQVGVSIKSTDFLNATMNVSLTAEQSENKTMREVLGWVAEAACSNARFNRDGQLEFVWFNHVTATYDEHNYTEFTPNWYEIKSIDGLHIRNADSTEEYVFGTGTNAYMIQDNPFLRQQDAKSPPVITVQPQSTIGTNTSQVSFSLTATNATSYQWKYSADGSVWTDITASDTVYSGGMTDTLTFNINSATSERIYKCTVSNDDGSTDSETVTATIVAIVIMLQPKDARATANSNITFTVEAASVDTYQWQKSTNNGTSWSNISGATGASYTVKLTSANESTLYRCKITNGNGTEYTDAVRGYIVALTITTQPENVAANYGDSVIISVVSENATNYVWKRTTNGGASWSSLVGAVGYYGADTDALTFTVSADTVGDGIQYKCTLSNISGTLDSNSVTATVTNVTITAQPEDVYGSGNDDVSMYVYAANADQYRWQVSKNDGSAWSNIADSDTNYDGANTNVLTFDMSANTASADGTTKYRCVINGNVESASASAILLS